MPFLTRVFIALAVCAFFAAAGSAQTKKRVPKKPPVAVVTETKPESTPTPSRAQEALTKRNERPTDATSENAAASNVQVPAIVFRYEFTQPEFINSRIIIEHGENGKGTLSFWRRSAGDEAITDPILITPEVMLKLKASYAALKFLDSAENYQGEKDFSHLGVIALSMAGGGRSRTARFNWTNNKDAKALADEYRKIANQYIWLFDIGVARENQPLQSTSLMSSLESMVKRGEISDAVQLAAALRKLSDDERLPLIARNHATRIITLLEKGQKSAQR